MTDREKLIEKIAYLLCDRICEEECGAGCWEDFSDALHREWLDEAAAILAVIHNAGYAIVPLEASPDILAAGWEAINKGRRRTVDMAPGPALREAWPRMVAASDLAAPVQKGGRVMAGLQRFAFVYRNHQGDVEERHVVVRGIRFGSTEWHSEPQWLLRGYDLAQLAEREFAMKYMVPPLEVESARQLFAEGE